MKGCASLPKCHDKINNKYTSAFESNNWKSLKAERGKVKEGSW